jgi:hypothetical protein
MLSKAYNPSESSNIMEEFGQIYPLNLPDQVSIRERERERESILQFPQFVKRYFEDNSRPFRAYFTIDKRIP